METSKLFDLIEQNKLRALRDRLEKNDECNFGKIVCQAEQELYACLDEENQERVKQLVIAVENKMEYIRYRMQVYLTNYAFRMGMEMQRAFDDEEFGTGVDLNFEQ